MKEMTIRKVVYGLDKEGPIESNWIGPIRKVKLSLQEIIIQSENDKQY